jgi:hypothetical protein
MPLAVAISDLEPIGQSTGLFRSMRKFPHYLYIADSDVNTIYLTDTVNTISLTDTKPGRKATMVQAKTLDGAPALACLFPETSSLTRRTRDDPR